ncbi:hypothetical protein M422DRAFT_271583 [Sphaerobolus stellatus SS14]|uniref:Uncharacterized protein n=1 Tax=Sphaerobolus stellatus (strain SS14) TaxID=990650 RepID=A0A0C9UP92_SPHS4|nr:hypothetical protein M422DRAFT_271583 [Sphaerobolus stellatus SS14]
MSMQWESILADNNRALPRFVITSSSTIPNAPFTAPTPSYTPSLRTQPAPQAVPPLNDAERTRLTNTGDLARGIAPGQDYVPVKREIAGGIFLVDNSGDGEDQPDALYHPIYYPDDDTSEDED